MIIDNINNAERYFTLNSKFRKAFEFIRRAEIDGLGEGRYELEGDELYAVVQSYTSKDNKSIFEGHRKYIDIQYVLSGRELCELVDINNAEIETPYSEQTEAEFLKAQSKSVSAILNSGDFGIFYPNDLHNPGLIDKQVCDVKKIVVKVKL